MLVAINSPRPRQRPRLRRGMAGLFDPVASAIQTVEGWFPGSVSFRLNNPGNLIYAGQPGAVPHPVVGSDGKTRIFAEFSTVSEGQAALDRQITLDASRGLTIAQFARKYAPAQDSNDPASYAARIAAAAHLSVNDPLASASSAAGTVTPEGDPGVLQADNTPLFTVDAYGQPWREAGLVDVSPVAWAALAVIAGLYVASAS